MSVGRAGRAAASRAGTLTVVAAAVGSLLWCGAGPASASFSGAATAAPTLATSTLQAPAGASASCSLLAVTVTWSASPSYGTGDYQSPSFGYALQRFTGSNTTPDWTKTFPATTTSYSDGSLGSYTYKVTSTYRSWTSQVTAAPQVTCLL